jgi:mannose-6-phosphate isomerase-like protein (cupin superfamily)
MTDSKQIFCASLAEDAEYDSGLRGYFEYRDLGMNEATQGKFHATICRVKPGFDGELDIRTTGMHRHLCDFQMFYVLKGWCSMYYEGEGEMIFRKGDCCMQPAGIIHNELQCSSDFECMELYSPAIHDTVVMEEV